MERADSVPRLTAVLFITLCTGLTAAPAPAGGQEARALPGQHAEKRYTVKLKATMESARCRAQASVEYLQRNTVASVRGEIANAQCAASGGEYMIAVRFRDEQGEIHNVEFEESWQRNDDRNFVFEMDYPIGENVDLMQVRARKLSCICAEAPDEDEASATEGGENE